MTPAPLLTPILKYKYQPERRSNNWIASRVEHCQKLTSLQPYLSEIFDECYQDARELAAAETGLSFDIFPAESALTLAEILNPNSLPE
jgi:Domain of unknown function DUF29